MKKIWIFIAGVVTGMILLFFASVLFTYSNNNEITLFDEPGKCINGDSFRVFQVFDSGDALARCKYSHSIGITVLLLNKDGESYYDNQIINIPLGGYARQIGVFKYETTLGKKATVPIVEILND